MGEIACGESVKHEINALLKENAEMATRAKERLEKAVAAYVGEHGALEVEELSDWPDIAIIQHGVTGPLRAMVEQAHTGVIVAEAVEETLKKLLSRIS